MSQLIIDLSRCYCVGAHAFFQDSGLDINPKASASSDAHGNLTANSEGISLISCHFYGVSSSRECGMSAPSKAKTGALLWRS